MIFKAANTTFDLKISEGQMYKYNCKMTAGLITGIPDSAKWTIAAMTRHKETSFSIFFLAIFVISTALLITLERRVKFNPVVVLAQISK